MSTVPPPYDMPPPDPWHRRYWRYSNRPFPGCGCLTLIILAIIVWWIIAAFSGGRWW